MGFVQDEEAAWAEGAEPVAKRPGVGLVNQEALRNQKPRVRGPWVDAEPALAAHSLNVILVQNFGSSEEIVVQLRFRQLAK